MDRLFKVLYFAGMVVEIVVRLPYDRQRKRIRKTDRRVTLTEQGILTGLLIGMLLLPLVHSVTSWLDFANYRLSPHARARMGAIGALLMGATLWLFWRSHRDLGANWSPTLEIGEHHTLVTSGIYGVIRHPMYASEWLWGCAQVCLIQNWIAGPASLVAFIPFYLLRVPREEGMILDTFGDAYRAYCSRTSRVIPRQISDWKAVMPRPSRTEPSVHHG